MSQTQEPTAPSIVQKLEQLGHQALDAAEHAAVRLVGEVAVAETSLLKLEASSPLVKMAIDSGLQSARNYGIPVDGIIVAGEDVLALAKNFAAGLAQPPAPPPATGQQA